MYPITIHRLVLISLFLCINLAIGAVPARPVRTIHVQPDGTKIAVTLRGDESFHLYYTDDNLPLLKGKDEGLYHATLRNFESIEPSTLLAHEAKERELVEEEFIRHRVDLAPFIYEGTSKRKTVKNNLTRSAQANAAYQGTRRGLVILVQFADVKFSIPQPETFYQQVLNGEGAPEYGIPASVNQYFLTQSQGMFDLQFDVVGPITLSRNLSYYGSNDSSGNDIHTDQMVAEAARLASPIVDYSTYDWNADGEVDQLFILYAGYSEAQNAPSYTIWPHAYQLKYTDSNEQLLQGVYVNTYACSSELSGNTGVTPDGIGTFCHEFSHCMGLPDLYDVDYSGGYGMYIWSLMDMGCYCGPTMHGEVPCNYTGLERAQCGWAQLTELTDPCSVHDMESISEYGPSYIIRNQGYTNEFYLLENRQQIGWDAYLPAHGLLIAHIDYDANAWIRNTVNDVKGHQRFSPIPADNNRDENWNGVAGDIYPGTTGNTALTDNSTPAATLFHANENGKRYMGRPIEEIKEDELGRIHFIFDGGEKGQSISSISAKKQHHSTAYTLQGVPCMPNQQGIIIQDGKKVLIRK